MRTPSTLALALLLAIGSLVGCGDSSSSSDDGTGLPPLQAGIAEVRMPVPVGIGTVGYFGVNVPAEPSPFARRYPATTRVHAHPTFRAVALSRGPGHEVVFLRGDLIGVFQQFRRAVVLAAEERLGRPLDDAILFGATHTHAGPGRILDGGGVFDLIADAFFAEFYEGMVDAAATAIVEAFADLAPARLGHTWVQCKPGHADRRCEDGRDYTNDDLPLVAIERDGKLAALIVAYAVHSTALGIEDLTLSRDVAGAIEEQIEHRFTHPVLSLFFNSWGADMAPGDPHPSTTPSAPQPNAYERMNRVGRVVGDAVHAGLGGITWEDDPEIFAQVQRVALNRTAIGYAEGEFPYRFGGVFCGGTGDTDCDVATTEVDLDKRCIPFPPAYPVPPQTELSAGRLGSLAFVTFPGEPGTLLAEELLGRLRARHAQTNVMFLGYTQDFTGYSILEDDWWQGGYEASGALWGPRQGAYLVDQAEQVFSRVVVDRRPRDPLELPPLAPFPDAVYVPYEPAEGQQAGTIATDVAPNYARTDVVSFTVRGNDPWLGAPVATLERENGQPLRRSNGTPVDSDDYGFWVDLVPEPSYRSAPTVELRTFLWTFSMPASQAVPDVLPDLAGGRYRLRVALPTASGTTEVVSAPFAIGAS